jgi:hypothetical protein
MAHTVNITGWTLLGKGHWLLMICSSEKLVRAPNSALGLHKYSTHLHKHVMTQLAYLLEAN